MEEIFAGARSPAGSDIDLGVKHSWTHPYCFTQPAA